MPLDASASVLDQPASAGRTQLWINPADRAALERSRLSEFEAMMRGTPGRLLRRLPMRENWRLEITDAERGVRGAYLKRHLAPHWMERLRVRCGLPVTRSEGLIEAQNIAALERDGIATMRLIAFGQQHQRAGWLESFVLTEELAGYRQLDHYLRERFAPGRQPALRHDGELAALIDQVAAVARRFHDRGYNHRDLYCCHFFIRETGQGAFDVRLIDLQRVQRRHWFRHRWIVKDLAQLAYSAPREIIGPAERLRFIQQYLGVRRLSVGDKRLVRSVLSKQAGMQRRLGLHP